MKSLGNDVKKEERLGTVMHSHIVLDRKKTTHQTGRIGQSVAGLERIGDSR